MRDPKSTNDGARADGDEAAGRVVPFPSDAPRASEEPLSPADELGEDSDLTQLREALDELRNEIRSRFPGPSRQTGSPPLAVEWMPLVEELRRRLGTLGMRERSGHVDEFGMDDVVMQRAARLFDFLQDRYWRIDVLGLDRVPSGRPVLYVANRSGLLPYDGIMLSHLVERARPEEPRPRFLVADWLVTLPFVQPQLARIGGVRACRENADRLLRSGRSVVAFPEGVQGAAKVFRERYRLKRFGRGGVIRTALENGVPLVPVGIVGAEEAHPILFKWHLPARALGLPFLPVTPTFPWMGPAGALPLPTKWVVSFGEPLDLRGPGAPDASTSGDPLALSRLTQQLRTTIDGLVHQGLEHRPSVWG
ncbi:MAG: lysophospholipid acyltransferase family protein [Myxococcota bacterium]